jgi:signal transduction histidine kinase
MSFVGFLRFGSFGSSKKTVAHSGSSPIQADIDAAILDATTSLMKRSIVPVLVVAAIFSTVAYGKVSNVVIAAWLTLVVSIIGLRSWLLFSKKLRATINDSRLLWWAGRLSLASGLSHGLILVIFPLCVDAERALITTFLLGLATGVTSTSLGYRPIFLGYCAPTVGGVCLAWILYPSTSIPVWNSYVVAVSSVFLASVLYKAAEDHFRRFVDQIAQRETIAQALGKAEAANRAKTRFLAAASHDLRQPLQTLTLFGAALHMRQLDPKSKEIADQINIATRELALELDALLDVSKLDAGVVRVDPTVFSVGKALNGLVDSFMPIAERRQLRLELVKHDRYLVNTDRLLFDRIVRNIVDNALKYTDTGLVKIEISTDIARNELLVSISDTGKGIPEDQKELIFEEFYQIGNEQRDRAKGLGLGLSIVKRMSDLIGAQLSLESTLGHGTTMTLRLPLAGESASNEQQEIPNSKVFSADLKGLKILLLDDEISILAGMQSLLSGFGCIASSFSSIEEAQDALAAETFDIACVDFRLGNTLSGVEAIKKLCLIQANLPALLISGDTAPDRLIEANNASLTLLHKPVLTDLLLSEIARLTGR